MPTRSTRDLSRSPSFLLACCGMCLAGSPAIGQSCAWRVTDVPDFDQRRSGNISGGYLPGDGAMYCVPTAAVDWMAYFANRGIPQTLSLGGPRDWQAQSEYIHTSDVLSLMGSLMETDAEDGTDAGPGLDGLRDYISLFASGDLTAVRMGAWSGAAPFLNPNGMLLMHTGGGYLMGAYGRYTGPSGGTRTGGHCFPIQGVWDTNCGPSAPIMLEFRDPAHTVDDPYPEGSNQSRFHTNLAVMTAVTGQFCPEAGEDFELRTLYRLDTTGASHNFLDAYYAIFPTAGLLTEPQRTGQIRLIRPVRPTGNPAPAQQLFNTASAAGVVKGVAFAPDQMAYYYSADGNGTNSSGVWKLNPLTGLSTRIITLTGSVPIPAGPIAVSRHGDLYMIVGNTVRRYDLFDPGAGVIGTLENISPLPQNIAYDDKGDAVVIITSDPTIGGRRVLRWGRTLPAFGLTYDLSVTVGGVPCIQPDANTSGAYFVCGSTSGVLYRVTAQNGALVQTHSITHSGAGLTGLNVTDGNTLVYSVNGVLTEKQQNTQGSWVTRAGSRWAGREATGPVAIARSRSNHTAIESAPSFNNLPDPTVYPFIPPCYANCDASTIAPVLNVLDFNCFLGRFAAGHPYANCDDSTTAPVLNVLDFNCFLGRFAAGCP
jgi:hypothetical protein